MESFKLRIAQPQDMNRIIALYQAIIDDVTGKPWDVFWELGRRPAYEALEDAIANGEMLLGELEGEEELAACVVINNNTAQGYDQCDWLIDAKPEEVMCIHLFCVNPKFSGRGLGLRFLELMEDVARERGAKTFRLDVLPNNEPAQRLYKKAGYTDHGFYHLFYGEQLLTDFFLMEKVL